MMRKSPLLWVKHSSFFVSLQKRPLLRCCCTSILAADFTSGVCLGFAFICFLAFDLSCPLASHLSPFLSSLGRPCQSPLLTLFISVFSLLFTQQLCTLMPPLILAPLSLSKTFREMLSFCFPTSLSDCLILRKASKNGRKRKE